MSVEIIRVVSAAEFRDRLNAPGAEPAPLANDAFPAFVKSEVEKWAKVVAATHMTAE